MKEAPDTYCTRLRSMETPVGNQQTDKYSNIVLYFTLVTVIPGLNDFFQLE